jgi:NADH-quinone oxidoreductase subunit G
MSPEDKPGAKTDAAAPPAAEPQKDPNKVTLTINDQEVEVAKGTNLIEAARSIGVEIPHFCYHPGLKIVAVCRQCLVEVKGQPKLVPGCQTLAADGMEVFTASDKARDAQRQQLEFTLLNHPIDCPICDQVGECELQRLYFEYDCQPARHDLAREPQKKRVPIGARVMMDEERCILCWRCIRVCDEVAGVHELDLKERGHATVIATAPGQSLDNDYSLCTVDQCPVGALTERAFRFDTRAYRLSTVDSICPGCATGCHIELHTYGGTIRRTKPRFCEAVNRWWMCDDGRYIFQEYAGDRAGLARVGGKDVTLEDGLAAAAKALDGVQGEELIVLLSARLSTETMYAVKRLVQRMEGAQVFGTGRPNWEADKQLKSADRNPNSAGLKLVFGDDLGSPEDLEQRLSSGTVKVALCLDEKTTNPDTLSGVDTVIALVHRYAGIGTSAAVVLPMAAWCETDGSFVNKSGQVGRFHPAVEAPGDAEPGWVLVDRLAEAAGKTLDLGGTAREVYAAASDELGAAALPAERFGPTRPAVLLRFANGRG